MRPVVIAWLLGCGGPARVPEQEPAQPAVARCVTVGRALTVEPEVTAALGEAAVTAWRQMAIDHCGHGRWPERVIDCVARTKEIAGACFQLMPEALQTSYEQREGAWSAVWNPRCSSLNDGFGADAWKVATHLLAPRVDDLHVDLRAFSVELREWAFANACDRFGVAARRCFAAAKTTDALATCRSQLDATETAALDARLAPTDQLVGKLRDVYRNPAAIDCATVLVLRYGDAAWSGRFTKLPQASRKAMIAASRARLRDACPKLAQSSRACLVVGTDVVSNELCTTYDPAVRGRGSAAPELSGRDFGFPATGVVFETGDAECDRYAAAALATDRCANLATRAQIRAQYTLGMRDIDGDRRDVVVRACPARADEVEQQLVTAGCAKR